MSATFLMREDVDWKDSLVLVAFPTAGNAGNIAGHYIRKHLDLPMVGSIQLDGQPGIVAVEGGIASSPLRIYGGQVECSLGDHRCPTIHLVVTDVPLGPDATAVVAKALLDHAKDSSLILCLDAVVRASDDDTPDVYCTSPDPDIMKSLTTPNVVPLPGGILVGMSGQILLMADKSHASVGALLVEAHRDLPDGRAAAALVKAIDHLIPTVKVDPEPLQEEAEELEKLVKQAQQDAESHERRPSFGSYI